MLDRVKSLPSRASNSTLTVADAMQAYRNGINIASAIESEAGLNI